MKPLNVKCTPIDFEEENNEKYPKFVCFTTLDLFCRNCKTNQKEFRVEKVIKKKVGKCYHKQKD